PGGYADRIEFPAEPYRWLAPRHRKTNCLGSQDLRNERGCFWPAMYPFGLRVSLGSRHEAVRLSVPFFLLLNSGSRSRGPRPAPARPLCHENSGQPDPDRAIEAF